MPHQKPSVPSVGSILMLLALAIVAFVSAAAISAQAQTPTYSTASRDHRTADFPNGGLILEGSLQSTTSEGGTRACDGGCGTVFQLSPAGKEIVPYSFTGKNGDGSYPPGELVRDAAGKLYATTYAGGTSGTP
jgi:hypothetical protein